MKKTISFLLVACLTFLLIACSNDDVNEEKSGDRIEVQHELDTDPVNVPENPERIVVFDLGALDTIQFLGEEDRVIGLPKATIPHYLEEFASDEYENYGSLKEPEFEKIHAANPDLIIISNRQMELYDQFKEIAPTIYLDIDTHNYLNDFEKNAKLLGKILNKEEDTAQKLELLHDEISLIQNELESSDETALIVLGTEGKVSAYGPASRFGLIHDVFGITPVDANIEESTHGQSITFEYILETNPDIIYIIDRDLAIGMESGVKDSFENEIIEKTKAYQNDRLIYLDGDVWYLAGGGLQSFSMMIDEIKNSMQ